ncbi:MAG: ornithine carbamoyltransferase [Desulfarculaceae bacterium]|jgi:ornithine carbamoyltransferase
MPGKVDLKTKHLLTIRDLSKAEIQGLLQRAADLKAGWPRGERPRPLQDKSIVLLFEKHSTRTRISFDVGIGQLGGQAIFMSSTESQITRGEPLPDTARILSRYADGLVVRTFGQEIVKELAQHGTIPVINGLTDLYHPCQVLSDLLTVQERLGDVTEPVYCWLGDGNNMAHSWLEAAALLKLELRLACPEGFEPQAEIVSHAREQGARIVLTQDPREAIAGAQVVSTDVWASMGQEDQAPKRKEAFSAYQLDQELLSRADSKAMVMHCLPAHRGEEISAEVLEGPQSVVWDQAENRLHMQKAILESLAGD